MLNVAKVRQLFDDLERAASKIIAPHKFNIGLMDAGRRTEVPSRQSYISTRPCVR